MLGLPSSGHLCRRPCSCFSHAVRAAFRLLSAILPVTRWTSWHVCRWSPASLVIASFVSSTLQAHPQPTLPPTGENPVGYPHRDRLRFGCAMALPPPALFSSRRDLPQHFWHSLHQPNIFDTIRTEPSFFNTGTFVPHFQHVYYILEIADFLRLRMVCADSFFRGLVGRPD